MEVKNEIDAALDPIIQAKVTERLSHAVGMIGRNAMNDIISEERLFAYRVAKAILDVAIASRQADENGDDRD